MVWTVIPDSDIDPDSPITTGLMTAYRDNFAAMAAGDSGAPSIAQAAFAAGAVGAEIATLSLGDVGSYALLSRSTADTGIAAGSSYAGSGLRYAGYNNASTVTTAYGGGLSGTPSGTWLAMGYCLAGAVGRYPTTVFLRIS